MIEITPMRQKIIQIERERGNIPERWSDEQAARYLDRKAAEAAERLKQINK